MMMVESCAISMREPCQVRKEAAVSSVLRVPWELWNSCKEYFDKKVRQVNDKYGDYAGFLPSKIVPQNGDKFILSPAYVFPSQIFEQRTISPSKYFRRVIIVDACSGTTELTEYVFIPVGENILGKTNPIKLKRKISVATAVSLAQYGTLPYENRHFGRILKKWMIFVSAEDMKLMWRIFIIRNNSFIDAFTGRSVRMSQSSFVASRL